MLATIVHPLLGFRFQYLEFVSASSHGFDSKFLTMARLISKHAWLYTEMLAAETIVYQKDNLDRFLYFPSEQHPIVLEIGGSNSENLAKATQLANIYKYDGINFKYEYFYGLLRDLNTIDEVNAARKAGAHGVMVNLLYDIRFLYGKWLACDIISSYHQPLQVRM
ncbi:uncharacterized protein LOC133734671 isoform X2 [Rosa rugosa]|uniref:uncharacterized protein LOC133734671 isoform X2 n=1 Tax=Rosa rugosa TaxID=74645 RepID=UPI002B417C73|nr:uncharacterized protein LOC133734671 isoform X2 [Rosa rugosa]